MSRVLYVHSQVPFLCKTHTSLHVFRTCRVDDVWRVSTQTTALLSRVRITRDAGSIGVDRAAGIVQRTGRQHLRDPPNGKAK
jgi:hypothetical protein